jgi:hypothetical protein
MYYVFFDDVSISIVTNVNETAAKEVRIYPNPAQNTLYVQNAENSIIRIYDVLGNVVSEINNTNALANIDMSGLSNGNYVVKVISGTKVTTQKINVIK